MRILIAPNAFKGSLGCIEAARAFAAGVKDACPDAETVLLPLSDGGDGLIDAWLKAKGGTRLTVRVRGPLGERRQAVYGWTARRTAVIEMARASGLALVPGGRNDPLRASSFGTGQLIDAALRRGARRVIVGLGGSASSDGGAGMAQALGVRLLDGKGRELSAGAGALRRLERIDPAGLDKRLRGISVTALSDVDNPLLGPQGSARVYGPQKGASPAQVRLIEEALGRWAERLKADLGADVAGRPGAGAAGGLGAGLLGLLGARVAPGAATVLRELGARRQLARVRAALTGEGAFDATDFHGKAPYALLRLARSAKVPAALVCGRVEPRARGRLRREGVAIVVPFADAGARGRDGFARAAFWARRAAALAARGLGLAGLLWALAPPARAAHAEIDRLYFHRHQERSLEESVARAERRLEAAPEDAEAWWRLARGLVRSGERVEGRREKLAVYERAEQAARRAIELQAGRAEAHFWRGVALGRIGQTRGLLRSLFLVDDIKAEMKRALEADRPTAGLTTSWARSSGSCRASRGGTRRRRSSTSRRRCG